MFAADGLLIDKARTTRDGYLAVRAKAARTGVYQYGGAEIDPENKHGLRDADMVNVLRDEGTVFDPRSAHSFIGKPVTNDHPAESVNSANWCDHARGIVMGAEWQEGGYLAFDLMLTDAPTIAAVKAGKRELSNGYTADLEFGDFTAPDGTKCQARQTNIVGNHVAIVHRGRAGSMCAIKDVVALCDANPAALADFQETKIVAKLTLDGLVVDLTDAAAVEAAIRKLQDAAADKDRALADAATKASEATGKIAVLEKQLADAKAASEPAAIEKRVADRAALIADAKKVKADIVTDGKADADIRRECVTANLGDAAKDMDDAAIGGAFTAILNAPAADTLRNALKDGAKVPTNIADSIDTARRARLAALGTAYRGKAA